MKLSTPYWLRGAIILIVTYSAYSFFPVLQSYNLVRLFFVFVGTLLGLDALLVLGGASFATGGSILLCIHLIYLGFVGALWGNIYENWSAKDKESRRVKRISVIIYLVLLALAILSAVLLVIGFSND